MDRIGAGPEGSEEIKAHPFFNEIDWNDILNKKAELTFKIKKKVVRQNIPIDAYIEAIGKSDENHNENWSFVRV
jgi:hypothetical protein